jgi:hypothetical protein
MAGWDDLPGPARDAVTTEAGPVRSSRRVQAGDGCDVAAVIETAGGPVFVKAVHGVSPRMKRLRREHASGGLAPGIAPAPLFAVDAAGWLVVGFEFASGRPAALAPGSRDLALVGAAVDRIASMPAPGAQPLPDRWAAIDWWERVATLGVGWTAGWDVDGAAKLAELVPGLVAGDRLVHMDLHADQFLIDGDTVRVVDWAWPAAGAPWVDAALLVIRLTGHGLTPRDAERWAAGLACWDVDADTLSAFACYVAGLWSVRAVESGDPAMAWRARLARRYTVSRIPALIR